MSFIFIDRLMLRMRRSPEADPLMRVDRQGILMSSLDALDHKHVSETARAEMIAREIRVQQSVEIQRSIPSQVFGNTAAALVVIVLFWDLIVQGGVLYAYAPLVLVNVLAARSFIRLRHRGRPKV